MGDSANSIYQEQELEQPVEESTIDNESYENTQIESYQGETHHVASLPLTTASSTTFGLPTSTQTSTIAPPSPPSANRTPIDLQKELEREATLLKQLQNRFVTCLCVVCCFFNQLGVRLSEQLQRLQAEELVLKRYVEGIASYPTTTTTTTVADEAEGDELVIQEEEEEEEEVGEEDRRLETVNEDVKSTNKRPSKRKRKSMYEYKAGEGSEEGDNEEEEEEEDDDDEKSSNDLKSILMSKLGRNYRSQFSSASVEEDEDDID